MNPINRPEMKLGFTGSRETTHPRMKEILEFFIVNYNVTTVHHGDCIGCDKFFHDTAVSLGLKVVIHPPSDNKHRAFCSGNETRQEIDYIKRNKNIVNETDMLLGCPTTNKEVLRSGTWATLRYARKIGRPFFIWGTTESDPL